MNHSPPRNPLDTGRFQKIARTFSGDYQITVDASTFKCAYDPSTKVIYIPANSEQLPQEQQDVVEGQLDHEMLHAKREQEARDARARGEEVLLPSEAMGGLSDPKRKQLLNVIADVADESWGAQEYVGISRHLDTNNEYCLAKLRQSLGEGKLTPWRQVTCGFILAARGWSYDWLPPDSRALVKQLAPEIAQAQFCQDAKCELELAGRLWERIKQLAEQDDEEKPEPEKGKGEGEQGEGQEGEGEKGEGEKGEGQEGEGEQESSSSGEEEGDQGEGKPKKGEGKPSAKRAAKAAMEAKEDLDDLNKLAQEKLSREALKYGQSARRSHIPHPMCLKLDREHAVIPGTQEDYARLMTTVRPVVSALRSKMLTVLRARAVCRIEPEKDEGALDPTQLHRLFGENEDQNVFYVEVPGQTLSVAVSILRDFSGSMSGQKAYLEQLACLAITEALEQLHVPTEVIGFHNPGDISYTPQEKSIYNRFEPFVWEIFKTFSESYRRVKLRFADDYSYHIGGDNSDAEAVMYAARRLAMRREARRILIVLSDGMPAAIGDMDLLLQATQENVAKIRKAGVEVVGIGIMSSCVERIYPDHIVVRDVSTLAQELFRVMKRLLLGGAKPQSRGGAECRA